MNYWAWGGKYIGRRSGGLSLFKKGTPSGTFYGDELYDFSGKHIREIRNQNRIIVNKSHKSKRKSGRCKPCGICGCSYSDYVGYVMLCGYEDFKFE